MSVIHYFDSHAHIMAEEYKDDFEEMLKRAEDAHVDRIMIITLSHEETMRAIAFAKRDPGRYQVAAGIFPEDVKDEESLPLTVLMPVGVRSMLSVSISGTGPSLTRKMVL